MHYRIAFGPNRGKRAFRLQTQDSVTETKSACVAYAGFSLHAGVSCKATERQKLERLCRYITRPAIANERLRFNKQGNIVCQLITPYRDGTTHLIFTPLELLQRLSALIPRPRINLIRYHGILAPNAKQRAQVVPTKPTSSSKIQTEETQQGSGSTAYRQSWAVLLKRVFAIDLSHCSACGGSMKIAAPAHPCARGISASLHVVAAITNPGAIHSILTHLGLSPQPPPRAPARYTSKQDDLL